MRHLNGNNDGIPNETRKTYRCSLEFYEERSRIRITWNAKSEEKVARTELEFLQAHARKPTH